MTKLSSAFNSNFDSLRVKTFEIGSQTFKVRVPLTKELDAMNERIAQIDEEEQKRRVEDMAGSFRIGEPVDGVIVSDDDVVVDGRSTKELVRTILEMENRIVEFVRLLVPQNGTLEDITYAEIDAEWPMAVQLEILSKINEAIQPGYKDSRKN